MDTSKLGDVYSLVSDFKQLQFHYGQKSDETERIKRVTERLLNNAPLIEKALYFMALGEQGKLDFVRANPDLCDAFEQGIQSGEIPKNLSF